MRQAWEDSGRWGVVTRTPRPSPAHHQCSHGCTSHVSYECGGRGGRGGRGGGDGGGWGDRGNHNGGPKMRRFFVCFLCCEIFMHISKGNLWGTTCINVTSRHLGMKGRICFGPKQDCRCRIWAKFCLDRPHLIALTSLSKGNRGNRSERYARIRCKKSAHRDTSILIKFDTILEYAFVYLYASRLPCTGDNYSALAASRIVHEYHHNTHKFRCFHGKLVSVWC